MNRFFSPSEKRAIYNITGVVQHKPLIFILKQSMDLKKVIEEVLTITFTGGTETTICNFKSMTDLCVVSSVPADLKLLIECKHLPC